MDVRSYESRVRSGLCRNTANLVTPRSHPHPSHVFHFTCVQYPHLWLGRCPFQLVCKHPLHHLPTRSSQGSFFSYLVPVRMWSSWGGHLLWTHRTRIWLRTIPRRQRLVPSKRFFAAKWRAHRDYTRAQDTVWWKFTCVRHVQHIITRLCRTSEEKRSVGHLRPGVHFGCRGWTEAQSRVLSTRSSW